MSPAQKQTAGSHQFNIPAPESAGDNERKDQKDNADAEYSDDPFRQTWNRKKRDRKQTGHSCCYDKAVGDLHGINVYKSDCCQYSQK